MKKNLLSQKIYIFCFLLIITIATFSRFYQLAQVPAGMTWDEAAIGYNGFSIIHTRRDEWLEKLPTSFRSFGDYKAPLPIYVNGVFTYVFGMNLWAVRLPFALSGVFAVIVFTFTTEKLFSVMSFNFLRANSKKAWWLNPKILSLIAGFMLAISPWHIHFTRVGFESGMAVSFVLVSIYSFLRVVETEKKHFVKDSFFSFVCILSGVTSLYTYHSTKIVMPLIGFLLLILFFRILQKKIVFLLFPLGIGMLATYPLLQDALYGPGADRLAQTSVFNLSIPISEKILRVFQGAGQHFVPSFLIYGKTTTFRHGTGSWGVLYSTTFLLACCSVILTILRRKASKLVFFSLLWIIISVIPAAIGNELPHANRFLTALPAFIWLTVLGISHISSFISNLKVNKQTRGSHGEKNVLVILFISYFILIHSLLAVGYLGHYFTQFAKDSTEDFKEGYLEALSLVVEYEQGKRGKQEVNKVIFTDVYGQPYIYALFVRKTNPIEFHSGALVKYVFKKVNFADLGSSNAVIVAAGNNKLEHQHPDHIITGSDGSVRFKIFVSK